MSWKNYFQRNELSQLAPPRGWYRCVSPQGGNIPQGDDVTVRYGRGVAPVSRSGADAAPLLGCFAIRRRLMIVLVIVSPLLVYTD